METSSWLPLLLVAPVMLIVIIGLPCCVIGWIWAVIRGVRDAIRDGTWQNELLSWSIVALFAVCGAIGFDMMHTQNEARRNAGQTTDLQGRDNTEDEAEVRTAGVCTARVRRPVAEVPGSLPGDTSAMREVRGRGEDGRGHGD